MSVCPKFTFWARVVQAPLLKVLRTLGPCPSRLAVSAEGTSKMGSTLTSECPDLVLTCTTVEAGWFRTFICKHGLRFFNSKLSRRNMILQFFSPMSTSHLSPTKPWTFVQSHLYEPSKFTHRPPFWQLFEFWHSSMSSSHVMPAYPVLEQSHFHFPSEVRQMISTTFNT